LITYWQPERQSAVYKNQEDTMTDTPIRPSADLTAAISAWINMAVLQLDEMRLNVMYACLEREGADVRVVVRLREGAIILEGTNEADGRRVELFREDVAPLRPDDGGFALPDSSERH